MKTNKLLGSLSHKQKAWVIVLPLLVLGLFYVMKIRSPGEEPLQTLVIEQAHFEVFISSTASIQPEVRIAISPPVRGRAERVLIEEGSQVKKGQILAWMSSQDRVALIDAARNQGPAAVKKWSQIYKETPIYAPGDGKVIRLNLIEGQMINSTDIAFELSNRLIVNAQVDESDIRQIRVGQKARVRLDAFPEKTFEAQVSRISEQSSTANGVNIFQVTLLPVTEVPELKSGLTASSYFIVHEKTDAKLAPAWLAEGRENSVAEVFIRNAEGVTEKRTIQFGKSNGDKIEILSELAGTDTILYRPLKFSEKTKGLNFLNRKQK